MAQPTVNNLDNPDALIYSQPHVTLCPSSAQCAFMCSLPLVPHEITLEQSFELVILLLQVAALAVIADQECLQAPAAAPRHELQPAGAAALLAELPFYQEGCLPAPVCCCHLSTQQVQEVETHLQECVPAQSWLPADIHWQLSCKDIVRYSGVDPQLVIVRSEVMGSGGGGVISL